MENRKQLDTVMEQTPIDLFSFFVFIAHGNPQEAGAKHLECHNMRYDGYVTPAFEPVLQAICYSYSNTKTIHTVVVPARTENDGEKEVAEGISIRLE